MTDVEFEALLKPALIRAAELDYMSGIPSEEELDRLVIPSAGFSRKMSKLMKNPTVYIRNLRRPVYKRFMRTAAAVLLTLSMLFGLSMLNPDVRARVVTFFREWFENRTEYSILDGETIRIPTSVTLDYVPEGFEMVFEAYDSLRTYIVYESADQYFEIDISGEETNVTIDNEHEIFYHSAINDLIADVFESNDPNFPNTIVCYDSGGLIIKVTGTISVDEIIVIIENLAY